VEIRDCPAVLDLFGLRSLASVQGDLTVADNAGLITINGLENLQVRTENCFHSRVKKKLEERAKNDKGRGRLTEAAPCTPGDSSILFSPFFPYLSHKNCFLSSLYQQVVLGGVTLSNNPSLRHLLGLKNLQKVGGKVVIERNPAVRVVPPNILGALAGGGGGGGGGMGGASTGGGGAEGGNGPAGGGGGFSFAGFEA
jgi:hypothetical protein